MCICGKSVTGEHDPLCARGEFSIVHQNVGIWLPPCSQKYAPICVRWAFPSETGWWDPFRKIHQQKQCMIPRLIQQWMHRATTGSRCFRLIIRAFNLFAYSYRLTTISSSYKLYEKEKKGWYGQRIWEIEHCSFTRLVFSLTGGMAREATIFYMRLTSLLSEQWEQPYIVIMGWLQCTLGFSLLQLSIQCLWGAQS